MTDTEQHAILIEEVNSDGEGSQGKSSVFSAGVCTLCTTKLWRYKKNYKCNSCSKLVCAKCTTKTTNDSQESTRVCSGCVDTENVAQENKKGFFSRTLRDVKKVPGVGGLSGFRSEKVKEMEGVAEYKRGLPSWLFLLKPFHQEGQSLAIGALGVKVHEAKHLPAMDRFGTSDPFCEVYLTQPKGEDFKQRSKTKFKTLTPQWNSTFSFKVTTTLCNLHINIYDFDASGSNDLIGSVEIPISELVHQEDKTLSDWFTLKLSDEAKKKVMKRAIKHGKKNTSNLEAPQVKLTLTCDFSKIGEFASHFTENPTNVEEPEFDMDVMYATGMKLLSLTQPAIDALGEIDPILRWTDPSRSFMVLCVFMLATAYPFTIPIMVELFLIKYMFWQYVILQWKSESLNTSQQSEESKTTGINSEEAKRELKKLKEQKKAEREGHMNGLLANLATTSVSGAGMTETLQWVQNLLVFICETMEYVFGLFQWKDIAMSKVILASLSLAVLYSLFLPISAVILLGGSYIICMQTIPGQFIYWLAMSTITYITRPKAKTVEKKSKKQEKKKENREMFLEVANAEIISEVGL